MSSELDVKVRTFLERGDVRAAVDATLRALRGEILGYLHATVRDEDVANELMAQLGEQLITSLPRFRGDSSLRTYVYAIAWNLVRLHRRRASRERRRFGPEVDEAVIEAPGPRTATAPYLRTTAKTKLREARSRLTPEEVTLIVLRVDRDMSWKEIGEVLGVGQTPAETAVLRKRFERLVRRLREWVATD